MSLESTNADLGPAGTEGYFSAVDTAFAALNTFLKTEGDYVSKHDLIFRVVKTHLNRLRDSFDCWWAALPVADSFKIDTSESGYPMFRHVLELQDDLKRARKELATLPDPAELRDEMLDMLLRYRTFPQKQQAAMAKRFYFKALIEKDFLTDFTAPETIRHSINKKTRQPYYIVHWSVYDGAANLPMVYVAAIEDSTAKIEDAFRVGPWSRTNRVVQGLPNAALSNRFRDFVKSNSSYNLSLTTIATAMDAEFPTLHPKQLRRMILGPFYVGGLTSHGPLVQTILNGVADPANAWLLTWTLQELFSQSQSPARHGLWSSEAPKENYFINTNDLDCVQQGVSALERHALIPHDAYQAIFAGGAAADILAGHQTHIVSGDKLLRHV